MRPAHAASRAAKAVVIAGALFVLTPCSTQPSPVFSSTGTWSGSITDGSRGAGGYELVLPQPGSDAVHRGGTWLATFSSGSVGGSAIAPATGDRLTVTLGCTTGPGTLSVVISGTTMSGTYSACASLSGGSVNLTRQ